MFLDTLSNYFKNSAQHPVKSVSQFPKKDENLESKNDSDPDLQVGHHNLETKDFARYERSIANNLGYFAVSRTCFEQDAFGNYTLKSTTPVAQLIYWFVHVNTIIKFVFLLFLVVDYFGPVVFLDKIAAVDYLLCVGIAVCGTCIWGLRYPHHEIMHGFWSIENRIFGKLGSPQRLKEKVEKRHRTTVWIHLAIVWIGCGCLIIQFYADPKYCAFTYSAFEYDSWWLRIIFSLHEFIFMAHPWQTNTGIASLCTIEGVSLANVIEQMTLSLGCICSSHESCGCGDESNSELELERSGSKRNERVSLPNKVPSYSKDTRRYGTIEELIFDYRQLSIITDRFNDWVAFKLFAIHFCSYVQFISDVYVAIQVLKLGGGFMDVWFYMEDCLAGVYMIYRVYTFMSRVAAKSKEFLRAFQKYRSYSCSRGKVKIYTKIARSLKVVALRLGPLEVTPLTVLSALDTFGNYYVCVALW